MVLQLAGSAPPPQRNFVLTVIALQIVRINCDLSRARRGSELDLETPVPGDHRLAIVNMDNCAGSSATADQIDISSEQLG